MADRLSDVVLVGGPWVHRDIAANGCRFHVAEAGDGPLVLLLHGFPEMWWAWRDQLVTLADAGYRAVALDLRGVGASDKPPRGYDPLTLTADVAGIIRALGEQDAVVVGHGGGARVGWTLASVAPTAVRGFAVLGSAHPRAMREALRSDPAQVRASSFMLGFQRPLLPEHSLVANDAATVERYLRDWSAPSGGTTTSAQPGWPDAETAWRYRAAMQLPAAAHCALEVYRWTVRSVLRTDGRRWFDAVREPVTVPVLQLHGDADRTVLMSSVKRSRAYAAGPYVLETIAGVGHFAHEEAPDEVGKALLGWLGSLDEV